MIKKNISVNKFNSNWIKGLFFTFIFSIIIFLLSISHFIIDIFYTLNKSYSFLKLDSIAFPIQFLLSIFSIIFVIYLLCNIFSWGSLSIKRNSKRKVFNLIVFIFSLIFLIFLLADLIYRCFNLFQNMGSFLNANLSSLEKPLFIGVLFTNDFWKSNSFFILIISLTSSIFYLVAYFFQKKKYKSEDIENSKKETQKQYIKNLINSKEKIIKKNKQKDLSKKISIF